jgi:hypothetical protein
MFCWNCVMSVVIAGSTAEVPHVSQARSFVKWSTRGFDGDATDGAAMKLPAG